MYSDVLINYVLPKYWWCNVHFIITQINFNILSLKINCVFSRAVFKNARISNLSHICVPKPATLKAILKWAWRYFGHIILLSILNSWYPYLLLNNLTYMRIIYMKINVIHFRMYRVFVERDNNIWHVIMWNSHCFNYYCVVLYSI